MSSLPRSYPLDPKLTRPEEDPDAIANNQREGEREIRVWQKVKEGVWVWGWVIN